MKFEIHLTFDRTKLTSTSSIYNHTMPKRRKDQNNSFQSNKKQKTENAIEKETKIELQNPKIEISIDKKHSNLIDLTSNSNSQQQEEQQLKCCLKECKSIVIDQNQSSRVEVCVNPKKTSKSVGLPANRNKFKVNWNNNGSAIFHLKCYKELMETIDKPGADMPIAREQAILKEADLTAERFDGKKELEENVRKLAELIKNSNHFVTFIGAGASTSAGIGDYRGKSGQWTKNDTGREFDEDESDGVPYEDLQPNLTYKSLVKLQQSGLLKFAITQNCDNLMGKAGFDSKYLSELHGNVFVEMCEKCNKEYRRDFYVLDDESDPLLDDPKAKLPDHVKVCERCENNHYTGRKCDNCKSWLKDVMIHFGDLLMDTQFKPAQENAKKCDLMLSIGSTMLVYPASDLVKQSTTTKNRNLVIVNRQQTNFDKKAAVRIFGDCDVVFELLLPLLGQK